ncbi:hypothetical protein V2J09_010262 [Rumex salicifolius]
MDSSSYNNNNGNNNNINNNNNWLAFSPPHLSLFYPFFPPPPTSVDSFSHEQEDGGAVGGAAGDYTTAVPKLEDFLGGPGIYPGPDAFYGAETRTVEEAVGGLMQHGMMITAAPPEEYNINIDNNNQSKQQAAVVVSASATETPPSAPKKGADTFGHRTSIYRGVTRNRHRWTGRYEAHLWDNSCKREGQSRKGRQGGYDKEEKAARAYDLAALKYWGPTTTTNFPVMDYEKELEEMKHMARQEFVASLRRKSSGFSRGASIYRGVTRHHQHGRWQARIGRVAGNKDLYLGTFSTQEEAAEAYDIAAIKFRGGNAVTNFDISRYDVKSIATSNLPVGGLSNKSPSSSSSSKPTTSSSSVSVSASSTIKNAPSESTIQYHFPSSSSTTLCFGVGPAEQTACWPNQSAFPVTSPHEFNTDVSGGGYFGYGDDQQQMNASVSVSDVSFAVPTNSGSECGGDGSGRSCATKANLSALHTLIFGME